MPVPKPQEAPITDGRTLAARHGGATLIPGLGRQKRANLCEFEAGAGHPGPDGEARS